MPADRFIPGSGRRLWRCRPGSCPRWEGGSGSYCPVAALNSDYQLGRDPAAVFDLDALGLGPLADLGGVQPARRSPPPGPRRPASSAAGPPRSAHIPRQRVAQLPGVLFVQVDLVLGAIQPEPDRSLGGAAVQVIDEQGLDLLGRVRVIPLTDPGRPSVNKPKPDRRTAAPARSADTGIHQEPHRPEFAPRYLTAERQRCAFPYMAAINEYARRSAACRPDAG